MQIPGGPAVSAVLMGNQMKASVSGFPLSPATEQLQWSSKEIKCLDVNCGAREELDT